MAPVLTLLSLIWEREMRDPQARTSVAGDPPFTVDSKAHVEICLSSFKAHL